MHSLRNNYTLDSPQPKEASSSLLHSGPNLGDRRETLSTEGQLGKGIGGWRAGVWRGRGETKQTSKGGQGFNRERA